MIQPIRVDARIDRQSARLFGKVSLYRSFRQPLAKGSLAMILGMSVATFTNFHVVLSLVGILAGLVALFGMFGSKRLPKWTALFLVTTVLTSATGYFFPRDHILPSHIIGALSLVILAIAIFALYSRRLAGAWRWIYVVTAVVALYLNVFVAVFQSFLKVPAVNALAPTQSEPPFLIAQGVVLLIFIVLAVVALRSFHPPPGALA
jgi:hypothetical protein